MKEDVRDVEEVDGRGRYEIKGAIYEWDVKWWSRVAVVVVKVVMMVVVMVVEFVLMV